METVRELALKPSPRSLAGRSVTSKPVTASWLLPSNKGRELGQLGSGILLLLLLLILLVVKAGVTTNFFLLPLVSLKTPDALLSVLLPLAGASGVWLLKLASGVLVLVVRMSPGSGMSGVVCDGVTPSVSSSSWLLLLCTMRVMLLPMRLVMVLNTLSSGSSLPGEMSGSK